MDAVLARVLAKITPSPQEEQAIARMTLTVSQAVKECTRLPFTLAGSFTRGTWMRDKREFDVFILFPETTTREQLEKKGLALGKKIVTHLKGKTTVAYAEHPYVRAEVGGFAIDIVPCFQVNDPAHLKSAVDRTPFHNRYLAQHFHPKQAAEVRLLKQFLKAHQLYGSDSRTQGFSGYLCELLILHAGTFKKLVQDAAAWNPGVRISLEGGGRPFSHPLTVIDPVDAKRNVAAVISPANFIQFVSACRSFIARPTEEAFFFTVKKVRPHVEGRYLLGVSFARPDVLDDILYPQLRRSAQRLVSMLEEFRPLGWDVWGDPCLILIEFETEQLPAYRKLTGPPIHVRRHAREFVRKYEHDRVWVEGDHWVAETARVSRTPIELVRSLQKRTVRELQERGIASHIAPAFKRARIMQEQQLARSAPHEIASYLQRHVEKPPVYGD